MAQHKLRSRISQFKQPFLLGAVASAALLGGCGGETSGTGVEPGGLTGTKGDCPKEVPESGSECSEAASGLRCVYDQGCQRDLQCVGGEWEDHSPSCNPPPPELNGECPEQKPTAGDDCVGEAIDLTCSYGTDSSCSAEFKCSSDGWVDVSPTCNPPPALQDECPPDPPTPDGDCSTFVADLRCTYENTDCPYHDGEKMFTCRDDSWDYAVTTCNPPPPQFSDECPAQPPEIGSACNEYEPRLACEYDTGLACMVEVRCEEGTWENATPPCNPPPPVITECPTEVPTPGEDCGYYELGLLCAHAAPCDGGVGALCGEDGVWEAIYTACNPPAPETETSEFDGGGAGTAEPDADGGVVADARDGGN